MSWRNSSQLSFADSMSTKHKAIFKLDEINELLDWGSIEKRLSWIHSSSRGMKAYPPLLMFKTLLLGVWYNLSDERLEEQLARDLLFKRFTGLTLDSPIPDHSSIWRFRELISKHNLLEVLFRDVKEQVTNRGFKLKEGAGIVDATVVEAKNSRPKSKVGGGNTQDPEAGYNVKRNAKGENEITFGFKIHTNVDEDGFVNSLDMTAGNVHDSQVFKSLLTGEETEVYGDSAYKSEKHDRLLARMGIRNRILHRAYRNRPLTKEQRVKNTANSSIRGVVERVNGNLKNHFNLRKMSYNGIRRNLARCQLACMIVNLKRAYSIQKICMA